MELMVLFIEDILNAASSSGRAVGEFFLFRPDSLLRLRGEDNLRTFASQLRGQRSETSFYGAVIELPSGKLGFINGESIEFLVLSGNFSYDMKLNDACVELPMVPEDARLSSSLKPPIGVVDSAGNLVGVLSCVKKIVTPGSGATTYTCT